MKIRSITYFDNLQWPIDTSRVERAGEFIAYARDTYQSGGFEVQTTRLATPPFALILKDKMIQETLQFASELEELLLSAGFDYISIGPALPDFPESYSILPEVLANSQSVFVAGIMSSSQSGISPRAIKLCAKVIKRNAEISADGFDNLRFAALANVPPGAPFLPAAFHQDGDKPAFAIATEAADLAVTAIKNAASLEAARTQLIKSIETQSRVLSELGKALEARCGLRFSGIDFSFAPYPSAEQSIGTAIERLGVPSLGLHGSLAAVAFLAEALERAHYPRVGFSGVMLPLLEDVVLAQRAIEGELTVSDLLLYSAVCGTGLDTIPLPDDITEEQLYAILLDLAALAQRLGKPLTARLMPIPNKKVGDKTEFDFEFFANSRVMDLQAQPITGLLAGEEPYKLNSRVDG